MLQMWILLFIITISSCELSATDDVNPTNNRSQANFNPELDYGTVTDIDGNVYRTITIGSQTWMAENLRVTSYNDGSLITMECNGSDWNKLKFGAWCSIEHTQSLDSVATYGRFYNWHAVNTGKLAPRGWRVPTYADWSLLLNFLDGKDSAGGMMKENGLVHWNTPNEGANNSSGFTALPAGIRSSTEFILSGEQSAFWCSNNEGSATNAFYFYITNRSGKLSWSVKPQTEGLSIRCIKD